METKHYIPILTIAGSDCSGGAGIQADIKTISALGCYATSVVTAVTAQNTVGVSKIESVSPEMVDAQIRAVMSDIRPAAVKVGMVNDAATIHAIAYALTDFVPSALILDPVMVSTSGSRLMQSDALGIYRSELVPKATLLTPNAEEAAVLSGLIITDEMSCNAAGLLIARSSHCYVLIKGGHIRGSVKIDRLYAPDGGLLRSYVDDNVDTPNTHGTGCTLSAAIACFMARGFAVDEAVEQAKAYVTGALRAGADVKTGAGQGPLNHFFNPMNMEIV